MGVGVGVGVGVHVRVRVCYTCMQVGPTKNRAYIEGLDTSSTYRYMHVYNTLLHLIQCMYIAKCYIQSVTYRCTCAYLQFTPHERSCYP